MKRALVIGINNYPNAPLTGCINDAVAISNILSVNGDGSPNFAVKAEYDVATKAELKKLIAELFASEGDYALLYFSGHGVINELGGYILTPDFKKYDEGVSMIEILKLANESKARNKTIILDCCHSGAFGSIPLLDNVSLLKQGITIIASSMENEPSMEINGHGVFTNLLLEALKGGASDVRGIISTGSIYNYIEQALNAWRQRPVFKANISGFATIRKVVPHVPIQTLRNITTYFPAKTSVFNLNPTFEYTNKKIAIKENVARFKELQKLNSVGLVVPVEEDFMYWAAQNSKSCKLTPLGQHYWLLANEKRL